MTKRKKITYEGRKRTVEYFEEDEKKPSNGNSSNTGVKNEPEKGHKGSK